MRCKSLVAVILVHIYPITIRLLTRTNIPYLPFMKKLIYFLLGGISLPLWAQGGTEVYTAQLNVTENGNRVELLTNRSQNIGYDNQPSFWSEDELLYAATRNGQTDIVSHNVNTYKKKMALRHRPRQ